MITNKISESGMIGGDGRLRMPMDRLNAFFAEHKGERVIVQFEAAAPGSSGLQLAYYYNYIIPTVSHALIEQGSRMTAEQIDNWLVAEYGSDKENARRFDIHTMSDFLEWLKQFAAENLNVYIEDPKTL